jgi:hypothetical protein
VIVDETESLKKDGDGGLGDGRTLKQSEEIGQAAASALIQPCVVARNGPQAREQRPLSQCVVGMGVVALLNVNWKW